MIKYKKWLSKNIKNSLQSKTIFVTGGNSGIGFEATRNLIFSGAQVIWGCRNIEKAEVAKEKILLEFAYAKIDIVSIDLADINSIKNCVENLTKNYKNIDVIYNNAGVFRIPRGKTKQDLELVVGTNLFGTFYLNNLLLEYYKNSHFIFTTSITAMFNKFNVFDPFFERRKYGNFKAYGSSKYGINQIASYWALSDTENNRKFSLIHPGVTYTPLINKAYKSRIFCILAKGFMKLFFHSTEKASLIALYAMNKDKKFAYYGPRGPFALSGFPKQRILAKKYLKNNDETIKFLEGMTF